MAALQFTVGVSQHTTGWCRIITSTVAGNKRKTAILNFTACSRGNCPSMQTSESKAGKAKTLLRQVCLTCKWEKVPGCEQESNGSLPWSCTNMSNCDLFWFTHQTVQSDQEKWKVSAENRLENLSIYK